MAVFCIMRSSSDDVVDSFDDVMSKDDFLLDRYQ